MPPRSTQFSSPAVTGSRTIENAQIEDDYIPGYDDHTTESSGNAASSPTPSQQLLHGEDTLPGLIFDIAWDEIRFSNGELVTKTGKLGYRIVHRRQHGGRGKISSIWQFGANLSYTALGQRPKPYWLCKECHLTKRNPKSQLYVASGHASISNHLLCKHSIDEDGKQIPRGAATMKRFLVSTAPNVSSTRDFNQQQQRLFSSAYPDWVIQSNLSFSQATSKETITLFQLLRSDTSPLFYTSHGSLSLLIQQQYEERKNEIQYMLSNAVSCIHLSTDLWSSPNMKSLLALVAHFLDSTYTHRTVLLGLPRILGGHDGANIAESLLSITTEYKINSNLGAFIMDNATNNDTMVTALSKELYGVANISKESRLRCAGHIINLISKAVLYGDGITEFAKAMIDRSDRQEFEEWRKFGAIGKVHNTVKFIMRSDQRRQLFLTFQSKDGDSDNNTTLFENTERLLIKDGGVRWNSTYHMLLRALMLQSAIEKFQRRPLKEGRDRDGAYSPIDDKITAEDWNEVRSYLRLLRHFVEATSHLEGNAETEGFQGTRGAIYEVFIWMQTMWTQLDRALARLPVEDSRLRVSFEYGKEKLDEYWKLMVYDTPWYIASIILHPDLKMEWFETHWQRKYPDWVKTAKKQMQNFVDNFMKVLDDEHADLTSPEPEEVEIYKHKDPEHIRKRKELYRTLELDSDSDDNPFTATMEIDRDYTNKPRRKRAKPLSEYQSYLEEPIPLVKVGNPLKFWIQMSKDPSYRYPKLARLGIYVQSAPAMSSECERVFSEAKRLITDDRNLLSDVTIQAIQCQKNWLDNKLVHSELSNAVNAGKK